MSVRARRSRRRVPNRFVAIVEDLGTTVAAAVVVLIVLGGAGLMILRSTPSASLNTDPTIRLVGPPRPGECVVDGATDRVLGEIVGVLGRDGAPLMYRVQGRRRVHLQSRASEFPHDVWIDEVRVVPCRDVGGRLYHRA